MIYTDISCVLGSEDGHSPTFWPLLYSEDKAHSAQLHCRSSRGLRIKLNELRQPCKFHVAREISHMCEAKVAVVAPLASGQNHTPRGADDATRQERCTEGHAASFLPLLVGHLLETAILLEPREQRSYQCTRKILSAQYRLPNEAAEAVVLPRATL